MNSKYSGWISIFFVYTVWGIQALYWKLFTDIPLVSILAWRIIWSFLFLSAVLIATRRFKRILTLLKSPGILLRVALCAFLIAFNWLLNIYAAYSNQLVESSLGHYITPIIVICSGIFILKEKVRLYEAFALLTAIAGVLYLAVTTGRIPLIAVFLVITFAGYTFMKKTLDIDPVTGITSEVMLLAPFALIFLIYQGFSGDGGVPEQMTASSILLTASTGIFTALPLVLFSYGVRQINLSRLGFIQYYAPTLSLLIGVFIFREPFSRTHLISFIFIWTAITIVIVFSVFFRVKEKNGRASVTVKTDNY